MLARMIGVVMAVGLVATSGCGGKDDGDGSGTTAGEGGMGNDGEPNAPDDSPDGIGQLGDYQPPPSSYQTPPTSGPPSTYQTPPNGVPGQGQPASEPGDIGGGERCTAQGDDCNGCEGRCEACICASGADAAEQCVEDCVGEI